MIRSGLSLRVKYVPDLIKANFGVYISGLRASKVLSRGRIYGLITSICRYRPDNKRIEGPTIYRDTFNSRHQCSLYTSASITPYIIPTYEHFKGVQNA
jgi:hypothetical protein